MKRLIMTMAVAVGLQAAAGTVTNSVGIVNPGWSTNFTALTECSEKYGEPIMDRRFKYFTLEENVAILSELCSQKAVSMSHVLSGWPQQCKNGILAAAPKAIKKKLYSEGKSFVTKDGVNPCSAYMESLAAALNAPYFNGLNAWLSSMGVQAQVDVSGLPTQEYIDQLKVDILSGEKEPTAQNLYVLNICLGVEGYNAFVKKYNGQ